MDGTHSFVAEVNLEGGLGKLGTATRGASGRTSWRSHRNIRQEIRGPGNRLKVPSSRCGDLKEEGFSRRSRLASGELSKESFGGNLSGGIMIEWFGQERRENWSGWPVGLRSQALLSVFFEVRCLYFKEISRRWTLFEGDGVLEEGRATWELGGAHGLSKVLAGGPGEGDLMECLFGENRLFEGESMGMVLGGCVFRGIETAETGLGGVGGLVGTRGEVQSIVFCRVERSHEDVGSGLHGRLLFFAKYVEIVSAIHVLGEGRGDVVGVTKVRVGTHSFLDYKGEGRDHS
jgi:hypothetical protein